MVAAALRDARRDWIERGLGLHTPEEGAPNEPEPAGDLENWTPVRVLRHGGRLCAECCDFGPLRPIKPFFSQTVTRALSHPATMLFRRCVALDDLPAPCGPLPNGLIFHLSRCGSTLIAQMLAAVPRFRVISGSRVTPGVMAGTGGAAIAGAGASWASSGVTAVAAKTNNGQVLKGKEDSKVFSPFSVGAYGTGAYRVKAGSGQTRQNASHQQVT